MRILYITHLTERNGATIALRNIMQGMVERGVEVGLITPDRHGFICDEARELGVNVLCNYPYPWAMLKGKISFLQYLMAHWKTYRLINAFRPDIVHCNSGIIDYSLLGCFLLKTPMVWHLREYIDKDFGQSIWGGLWLHKRLLKLPFAHCIAITDGVFQHFGLSKRKDVVIYDGVIDANEKVSIVKNKNSVVRYFLFVGSFIEGKGAHVVFEQFDKIHQEYPDVEFWLACRYAEDSEYYRRCIEIAKQSGFEQNVRFLGFRSDVGLLMANAVALIVPSRFEAFGFITVEAMYNKCLVIGRNTAGTREQFDRGLQTTGEEIGLRFESEPELPSLMTRSLVEDFSVMKERARWIASTYYTTQRNVDEIFHLYQKLKR